MFSQQLVMKSARKRIKLECLLCGSQFDQDYKTRHEKVKHGGQRISIKTVGAPLNPFEAALAASKKNANRSQAVQPTEKLPEPVSGTSTASTSNKRPWEESDTETYTDQLTIVHTSECDTIEPVVETSEDNTVEPPIAQTSEDDTRDIVESEAIILAEDNVLELGNGDEWATSVALLSRIVGEFEPIKDILKSFESAELPNVRRFLEDSVYHVYRVKTQIDEFTEIAKKNLEKFKGDTNATEPAVSGNVDSDTLVEHDPGNRKTICSANQRNFLISLGPYQLKLSKYPVNTEIPPRKQKSFSALWYKEFPHLEYSTSKDAAFCFVCSLFPEGPNRNTADNAWTTRGVRQWHKMKSKGADKAGKLSMHFSSNAHKAALQDFCNFVSKSCHVDVLLAKNTRELLIRKEEERLYNREIVSILFDVASTLACQGIAFRGNVVDTNEQGNFVKIVHLMSRHLNTMKNWLDNTKLRPYHVTYMSNNSQNEFISLLASKVSTKITEDIKEVKFFSVIADTTPDLIHRDQLSVIVRYVKDFQPYERLLDIVEIEDKTGKGSATAIYNVLIKHQLPTENLVFQSYDCAASMRGEFHGAQKYMSDLIGHLVPYFPCMAHRVNTFTEHCIEASIIAGEMFNNLESIYVFFTSSTKRFAALDNELAEIDNVLQLRNLSKTRWTARAESIRAVWTSYEAIVGVLETLSVSREHASRTRTDAMALLRKMKSFDFICGLMFMKNVMYKLKNLTEKLEEKELNVLQAVVLLDGTSKVLKNAMEENDLNNLIDSSKEFCKKMEIDYDQEFRRHHRRRVAPKRIDENADTQAHLEFHTFYRQEFKLIIDTLCSLLDNFLKENLKFLQPFFECVEILSKPNKIITENLTKQLVNIPPSTLDVAALTAELQIFQEMLKAEHSDESHEHDESLFQHIVQPKITNLLKTSLPLTFILFQYILTAPVSVASSERSFSKLKFIKNHLRTTMTEKRLGELMILSSEKDIVQKIDLQALVNTWSMLKERRVHV